MAEAGVELDVRLSRFGEWFSFEIHHEDQLQWSTALSARGKRSIAVVIATIATSYNAAARTDVPMIFVTSDATATPVSRDDVVDVSDVYRDVYESFADVPGAKLPYAVFATKTTSGLAALIETFGVFGMVFPIGIQANLWLQLGANSWDFILNDRAAEHLPDHVLAAFAAERLALVPNSPQAFIHRKAHAEDTVRDFTRPHSAR